MNINKFLLIITFGITFFSACSKSSSSSDTSPSDPNSSPSDIITGTVSGAVSGTSASTSMAFQNYKSNILNYFLNHTFLTQTAFASSSSCPTLASSTCSGIFTLTYNGCSFGSSKAIWTGNQYVTFTSGTCQWTPAANAVFTRTFSTGTTRLAAGGVVTVSLDTTNASGFSSSVSGGETITVGGSWPNRTIAINGLHLVAAGRRRCTASCGAAGRAC